ncbi:AraC family transcriptional regulator [Isoptericola sp. NPDC055881]
MAEFWHSTELPHLESRRSCQDAACYRPHAHDRFSIGLVDTGTTAFTGPAGGSVPLAAGDVILIPAGHVHACNPGRGRWEYQMIHADQRWIASLLPEGGEILLGGITVVRDRGVHRRFDAVNDLLFAGPDARQAATGDVEATLRRALNECMAATPLHRLPSATDIELLDRLGPALDRLHEDASNPALTELAEAAGMDRYQLIRAMRRATGLTPVAWRHNDRVITARTMLREGRSLAETAQALGFADQSHFHRVFCAHVAATPGAYRR